MVRKLKYHEATLLRKLDFINWKSDSSVRENKILRRYHVQDREDYHTYNKVCGMITKLVTQLKAPDKLIDPASCSHIYSISPSVGMLTTG